MNSIYDIGNNCENSENWKPKEEKARKTIRRCVDIEKLEIKVALFDDTDFKAVYKYNATTGEFETAAQGEYVSSMSPQDFFDTLASDLYLIDVNSK